MQRPVVQLELVDNGAVFQLILEQDALRVCRLVAESHPFRVVLLPRGFPSPQLDFTFDRRARMQTTDALHSSIFLLAR